MLVNLTPSQVMALTAILGAELLDRETAPDVHIDVVRQVETTPEELLRLLLDLSVGLGEWPESGDRQMILLALAILALDKPDWHDALRRIATQFRGGDPIADGASYALDGAWLFDEYRRRHAPRFFTRP